MNNKIKTICCLIGGIVGMVITFHFNKAPEAFDFALAALIGAGVTNWIIEMSD